MGCIYYHKNKINGHMYIGQSICNSTYVKYGRWGVHGQGYRTNSYFWNAIKKYGWENFEHGFFEDNIDNELLNEKEKYYIALYHTYRQDPEYKSGYNLTPGGEGSMNTWWPEEDAWLIDNYSVNKKRAQLVNEYRQAFPESYHSDDAIKARLKTLRLSTIDNVHFWSDAEIAALIELWPRASKAEICAALPNRDYEAIRSKAKALIKQMYIKEHRQVDARSQKIGANGKKHIKLKTSDDCKNIRKINCMPGYSEAEDAILVSNYQEHGPKYCQNLIKEKYGIARSLNSVKDHATKVLKLHFLKKFTEDVGFDLSSFAKFYYDHSIKETASEFKIMERQVINIARRNKLKRNKNTIKTGIRRKIYCIELDKVFESSRQAANYLGKKAKNNILACCAGTRQTAHGYHWKFID